MKLIDVYVTVGTLKCPNLTGLNVSLDIWRAVWKCVFYLKLDIFGLTTSLLKRYPKELTV